MKEPHQTKPRTVINKDIPVRIFSVSKECLVLEQLDSLLKLGRLNTAMLVMPCTKCLAQGSGSMTHDELSYCGLIFRPRDICSIFPAQHRVDSAPPHRDSLGHHAIQYSLQYSTAYNTVPYYALKKYNTVQYSTVQWSAEVLCNTIQCNVDVLHSTVQR